MVAPSRAPTGRSRISSSPRSSALTPAVRAPFVLPHPPSCPSSSSPRPPSTAHRYDYHFSAPTRGYEVGSGEPSNVPATPLAGMIVALQKAYAETMGGSIDSPNLLAVRNITSESDLSRHVQKKGQGTEARWTGAQPADDDSDGD